MALNIRDEEVDRLATEVARLRRVTKTQAVKSALQRELDRVSNRPSLWERLAPLRADIAGSADSGVVLDKAFFDELSGES